MKNTSSFVLSFNVVAFNVDVDVTKHTLSQGHTKPSGCYPIVSVLLELEHEQYLLMIVHTVLLQNADMFLTGFSFLL